MEERIKRKIGERFGAVAENYVASATHAAGEDLARLVELAGLRGDERVLDVATGGGHTALAFAPHVREVVASDLSPRMLQAAEAHARERGAANVRFQRADAEALPFESGSFDVVVSRIAAHHFPEPRRFVAEVARVLRAGGLFLLDDNMAPESDDLDAFMNRFERWRDPGHVRAHRASEWSAWMEGAGLSVEHVEHGHKTYGFDEWTARIRMPEAERAALERWLLGARPEQKEYFEIREEGGRLISLRSVFAIVVARR